MGETLVTVHNLDALMKTYSKETVISFEFCMFPQFLKIAPGVLFVEHLKRMLGILAPLAYGPITWNFGITFS